MEVILDTNFIISCIRKKIDFLEQLKEIGFKVVVPREVFEEMKDLRKRSGESHEDRGAIDVAIKMFENGDVKKMKLGGYKVDDMLIKHGKDGRYIATLDNGIKRNIPNKVIINNSSKCVEVVRD